VREVAVIGPTASGKSAVALAAARRRTDVELVSVDALAVYRGMDIGTAKASVTERAEVRHHLVDLVDAGEPFTVAAFQEALGGVRSDAAARGVRLLHVGGTGLYLRAVVDGLDLAGEWPEIRAALESMGADTGAAELHRGLAVIDPDAAARIDPGNLRRTVRALEVCLGSGRRFSSYGRGIDEYPPTPVVQVGLRWRREALAERIERRVTAMFDAGLVREVARLLDGPGGISRTAAQAVGYREVIAHLEGGVALEQTRDEVVLHTRQLAVRQERWFRRDPRIRWVDVDVDPVAEALPVVLDALDT
jgi:tRNA dimethylallyltransferase